MRAIARACLLVVVAASGCSRTAEPRGQVVLWIDTDVPVPSMADTLLIEQVDEHGKVLLSRTQNLLNASDWPVSFGVISGPAPTHFRVRLFPGSRVTLERSPMPNFTIDRVIAVTGPQAGVSHLRLLLPGARLGSASDEAELEALSGPMSVEDSVVGRWPDAQPAPCEGTARKDSGLDDEEVCIPGGVYFFGVDPLDGYRCGSCAGRNARVVKVSPFFVDRDEVTVRRFRAARAAGFVPPSGGVADDEVQCSTYGARKDVDLLPMNCITWETANAFCAFDGGRLLPTEAQWEYMASGRGEQRTYPWGEELPSCTSAAYGRKPRAPLLGSTHECGADGGPDVPPPIRSFPNDTSRDGVHDLGGSVQEWALDAYQDSGVGCWASTAPMVDPVCTEGREGAHPIRGGMWTGQSVWTRTAARLGIKPNLDVVRLPGRWKEAIGFRCVRPGTGP